MTLKYGTGLAAIAVDSPETETITTRERLFRTAFALVQWPWLLRALDGGRRRDKRALLARLDLPDDALPKLGSWKADTVFLKAIVDTVAELRLRVVVELGSGASTLVAARALQLFGPDRSELHSCDQHREFVEMMRTWLEEHGLGGHLWHAPLGRVGDDWPGLWYRLPFIPEEIDLLLIDGPPWAIHPFVRGAADRLFSRIAPGGMVLLDDAARPGERIVARRWAREWPDFDFRLDTSGSKGLLVGRRRA